MAMTIKTEGLTEVSEMLARLGNKAQEVASGALYDGASVVADAFTAAVKSIKAEKQRKKNKPPAKNPKRLATPEEKAALMGKSGIAKFNKDGSEVDTIIGISRRAGYADINGRKKPILEIARSINSGTSFMKKQPVFRKAVSSSQKAAKDATVAKAEKLLDEIINGK